MSEDTIEDRDDEDGPLVKYQPAAQPKDPAELKLEELQERAKSRRAAERAARAPLERLDEIAELEAREKFGDHSIAATKLGRPTPGLPGRVVVRKPDKASYKRYRDLAFRKEPKRALEYLCGDCLVYPSADVFERMVEGAQDLPDVVAQIAIALAKGGADESGKE